MHADTPSIAALREPAVLRGSEVLDASSAASAVSWGAILAGAAGAAALSLILLILGTGLGLSSVSPFSGEGVGAATFGVSAIAWLTFTQLAASGMGGYLAGRLRTRWQSVHTDEVYFRDTAHGFLAWAVASLATAALLSSVIGSIVNGGAKLAGAAAGGAATVGMAATSGAAMSADNAGAGQPSSNGYFVDSLFRKDAASAQAGTASNPTDSNPQGGQTEVSRIFANAMSTGTMSPEDTKYVGQLVAQRTGLAQADADKRVTDTFARAQAKFKDAQTAARDAADKARKSSAYAALWLFVSLLIGAFVASLAATFGGRRRDL